MRDLSIRITADASQALGALAQTDRAITSTATHAAASMAGPTDEIRARWAATAKASDEAADAAKAKWSALGAPTGPVGQASGMFGKLGGVVSGLAGGLAAMAAVNIGAKLVSWTGDLFDAVNDIADMADRMHISTDAAQKFKFAIDETNGSLPALRSSLQSLAQHLAGGKESTREAVAALGLSFETLRNQKPEEAFVTVADAIGKLQDPMQQAKVGADLLGKGFAVNLTAMTEGFGALGAKAAETGAIMSEQVVRGADKLSDTWENLKKTGMALLSNVLGPFLPILSSLLQIVVDLLEPFGKLLTVVLWPITEVLGLVASGVEAVVGWFTHLTVPVSEASSALSTVWDWLATKLQPVLGPIGGLLKDLGEMFAAMGRVWIAVHVEIIKAVAEMVGKVVEWLSVKLQPVIHAISPVLEAMSRAWTFAKDTIIGLAQAIYTGVKRWLLDQFQGIVDGIREKIRAVTGFFNDLYDKVVGHSYVPDLVREIGEWFAKLQGNMVEPTERAVSGVDGHFKAGTQSWATTIGGFASEFLTRWGQLHDNWKGRLASMVGSFIDIFINGISQGLATGQSIWSGILGSLLGALTGKGGFSAGGLAGMLGGGGMGAAGGAAGIGGMSAGTAGTLATIGTIGMATAGIGIGAYYAYKGIKGLVQKDDKAHIQQILGSMYDAGITPIAQDGKSVKSYEAALAAQWDQYLASLDPTRGPGFGGSSSYDIGDGLADISSVGGYMDANGVWHDRAYGSAGGSGIMGGFGGYMGTDGVWHDRSGYDLGASWVAPSAGASTGVATWSQGGTGAVNVTIDARGALFPDSQALDQFADTMAPALAGALQRAGVA